MSWVKGQKHTEEAKRKIGAAARSRRHSEETRHKIALAVLGRKDSDETRQKKREAALRAGNEPQHPTGVASSRWKGDAVGYGALHRWVRQQRGRPTHCEICGTTERRLSWANKDHTYRRVAEDYIALCMPCHIKYDVTHNGTDRRRKDYSVSEETRRKISDTLKRRGIKPTVLPSREQCLRNLAGTPSWNKGVRGN